MVKKQLGPGDDKEMILSEGLWPNWPLLPVKRPSDDFYECGLIWAGDVTTVVIANLFQLPLTPEQVGSVRTYEYGSVDDLLADGWVVD